MQDLLFNYTLFLFHKHMIDIHEKKRAGYTLTVWHCMVSDQIQPYRLITEQL